MGIYGIQGHQMQSRIMRAARTATDILMRDDPKQGLRIDTGRGVVYIAHGDGRYVVLREDGRRTDAVRFGMDVWAGNLRLSLTREGEEPESAEISLADVRSIAVGRGDADTWEGLEHRVLYDAALSPTVVEGARMGWQSDALVTEYRAQIKRLEAENARLRQALEAVGQAVDSIRAYREAGE